MSRLRIVADDKIPYLEGAFEDVAEVIYLPGAAITKEEIRHADALIIRTRTKCNQSLLEGTKVKFIATATIGYDHIDTDYCRQAAIQWTNAPGCNSGSVMQYIASALVSIAAKFNFSLKGKKLGIVGVGNVGEKVVHLAEQLGMEVLKNDPPRQEHEPDAGFLPLDEVLSQADILTFHVPLEMHGRFKTHHLVDSELLKKVKPGVFIINSSRGEVVDSEDLTIALKEKRIAGAILDVWENEPRISENLMAQVTLGTPHIAGYSRDGKANGTMMSVQALSRYFNLGKDHWQPVDVEPPVYPVITIPQGVKDTAVLPFCIHHTYQVAEDDAELRGNLKEFEKLRGDYPVRREFSSFTIDQSLANENLKQKLMSLGFKLK